MNCSDKENITNSSVSYPLRTIALLMGKQRESGAYGVYVFFLFRGGGGSPEWYTNVMES